jgi:hypothetical protein
LFVPDAFLGTDRRRLLRLNPLFCKTVSSHANSPSSPGYLDFASPLKRAMRALAGDQ